MKKNTTYPKEQELLTKLKLENKKLKREIASLRKVLARIDIDRYQNVKEILENEQKETTEKQIHLLKEQLAQQWLCHTCEVGTLRIIILNRPDGVFYFRKCDNCSNKTKLKPYHAKVEGLEK